MKNNRNSSQTFSTRTRSAILLGAGVAAGFWLGLAEAGRANPLPVAAAFAFAAVAAGVWLIRSRAREQTHAVWNAYAEREIARARPLVALRRRQELAKGILSRRDFDARPHAQTR